MDGIINVYKERDYTSHDVVARLRGILKTKKIGHTGTLDPMAEGVLPVCVGAATKLCESLSDHDKEYEAVMILGKTYDTLDVTGELIEEREVMSTEDDIRNAVMSFTGGYDQVPPMYSAKKIGGKKLYDLARSGIVVERKPVFVNIYGIDILSVNIPHVKLRISCGKGTYIRSLIDDIGKKLGCGAAMEELTRTRSGEYSVENAHRLFEIEEAMAHDKITDVMTTLEEHFSSLEAIHVGSRFSKLLNNGNVFSGKDIRSAFSAGGDGSFAGTIEDGTRFRMYDSENTFAGVYEYNITRDIFKPYKVFLKN